MGEVKFFAQLAQARHAFGDDGGDVVAQVRNVLRRKGLGRDLPVGSVLGGIELHERSE